MAQSGRAIFRAPHSGGLRRGSHTSIPQLRAAIGAYVDAHNQEGKPFTWTKTADEILEKMRRFGLRTQKAHTDLFQETTDPGASPRGTDVTP